MWGLNMFAEEFISVLKMFERQVEKSRDMKAIWCQGKDYSYGELNALSNQMAYFLKSHNINKGDIVGLSLDRSAEVIVSILAILKIGATYLSLDKSYPMDRLGYMLDDSRAKAVIDGSSERALETNDSMVRLFCDLEYLKLSSFSQKNLSVQLGREDSIYCVYTSGSSGRPKGVSMVHRSMSNLISWQLKESSLKEGSRTLQLTSISFDVSFQEVFSTLCSGGLLLIADSHLRQDPLKLITFVNEFSIERIFTPYVGLRQMCEVAEKTDREMTSLKEVITAGEQLQITDSIRNFFKKHKGCSLFNHYGPSETHVVSSLKLNQNVDFWPELPSIGLPISNTEFHILNKGLNLVEEGEIGQLGISGVSLAKGYLHRDLLTKEKFTTLNISGKGKTKIYLTGDLARRLPTNEFEFLGRLDSQVKIRGYRVEPGEVEMTLSHFPSVKQAVVVPEVDTEGRGVLVAYVLFDKDSPVIGLTEIRQYILQSLPDYMVPSKVFHLNAFPLTPSGKVDRRALSKNLGKELKNTINKSKSVRLPVSDTEKVVWDVWKNVLNLKDIDCSSNFFEIGGDSLLAVKVSINLGERFQVDLPVCHILSELTIDNLSRKIDELIASDCLKNYKPIEKLKDKKSVPLSYSQEEIFMACQKSLDEPVYNETYSLELLETIDVELLKKSFQILVLRHEVLRTKFDIVDGRPQQFPVESMDLNFVYKDLSSSALELREIEARDIGTQSLREPFDLKQGPLMRSVLIKMQSDSFKLYIAIHHLLIEASSMNEIFLPELEEIYRSLVAGRRVDNYLRPFQFSDYAIWQRQRDISEVYNKNLVYWKNKLEGAASLDLPKDGVRSKPFDVTGSREVFQFSSELSSGLKGLARERKVGLFAVLLSAVNVLMHRYSGQEDIVLGTFISNRNRPELMRMMGVFLDTVILRSSVCSEQSISEQIQAAHQVIQEAFFHGDMPMSQLAKELQPDRKHGANPFFQVAVVLDTPVDEKTLTWPVSQLDIHTDTSKFDLTFEFDIRGDIILGRIEYSSQIFHQERVQRMVNHLETLFLEMVQNKEKAIGQVSLMPERERDRLLKISCQQRERSSNEALHSLFEKQVKLNPNNVALIDGESQWRYGELDQKSTELAIYLQSIGVKRGELVGVCTTRSSRMIVAILGILKAGGAYVPLDPNSPEERVHFILQNSQINTVLTEESQNVTEINSKIRIVNLDRDSECILKHADKNDLKTVDITGELPAYVLYTSGSTGQPKGVVVSHNNVVSLLDSLLPEMTSQGSGEVWAQYHSFSFDLSVWEIFGCLCSGGTLVLVPWLVSRQPDKFLDLIKETKVTNLLQTPTAFSALLQEVVSDSSDRFRSVQKLLFCGEVLPQAVIDLWFTTKYALGTKMYNLYGPTEATVFTTIKLIESSTAHQVGISDIGLPLSNAGVVILDSKFQLVPIGVPGEIFITGSAVAQGYYNRVDLTKEKFIPNPFTDNEPESMYRTGDMGCYLSSGSIGILGRIDRQVKIRGFRIELGEIESALVECEGVQAAAVKVFEVKPGDQRIIGYIVPSTKQGFESKHLRSALKKKIPDYMLPSTIISLESLPMNTSGKVDLFALPEPKKDRVPDSESSIPPRDSIEMKLCKIWRDVLKLNQVKIFDDFFELGGHSILAIQLSANIQKEFGIEFPLAAFFETPNVAAIAERIRGNQGYFDNQILIPIQPKGDRSPFFCFPGVGGNVVYFSDLARNLGSDQPFYGLQAPGLAEGTEPLTTVVDIARVYTQEILNFKPEGPYRLGGHSFGAIVAFEVAYNLRQLGHEIEMLAAFDLPAISADENSCIFKWDEAEWTYAIAKIIEMLTGAQLNITQDQVRNFDWNGQMGLLKERMEEALLLPKGSDHAQVKRLAQMIRYDEMSLLGHIPKFCLGVPIYLFKTSDLYDDVLSIVKEIPTDDKWGWSSYSDRPVTVIRAAGSHATLLNEPHVRVLSQQLDEIFKALDVNLTPVFGQQMNIDEGTNI